MTKAAALHSFFGGFGLTAYEENSVPDDAVFPYLTYSLTTDSFSDYPSTIAISLWYRSTSWTAANAKCEEISAGIGYGGKLLCGLILNVSGWFFGRTERGGFSRYLLKG